MDFLRVLPSRSGSIVGGGGRYGLSCCARSLSDVGLPPSPPSHMNERATKMITAPTAIAALDAFWTRLLDRCTDCLSQHVATREHPSVARSTTCCRPELRDNPATRS